LIWTVELHRNARAAQRGACPFTDILSVAEGRRAYQDMRNWRGYAPTPLRDLTGVAIRAGVARVLYKDEASRFDLAVREAIGTSLSNGWHVVADTSNDPADEMPALVMHGYTSLVIETLEQLCSADGALPTHVFLQGGVGGLAAAVVSYLWEELGANQAPIFIIVEPSQADCLHQSALNGRPTPAKGDLNTLMAGLSCGEVSRVAWPILEAGVEFFMTVQDQAAIKCMRLLYGGALGGGSVIAGESGVAGLVGLIAATRDPQGQLLTRLKLNASSTVLLIGTEGATDPDIYKRLTKT
jgi:diaminopropionate ammonia-lyase